MSRALRLLPRLSTLTARAPVLSRGLSASASARKHDPFPLPFDPALAEADAQRRAQQDPEEVIANWDLPPPLDRTGESHESLRARLVYQTRKRGTLETDLLLSTFARDELPIMSVEQLMEFDKLLDEPDWDIFYWATEKRPAPERWSNTDLLARLIKHARNEGKVVRMMPELTEIKIEGKA